MKKTNSLPVFENEKQKTLLRELTPVVLEKRPYGAFIEAPR
jgi:hypothetical protein